MDRIEFPEDLTAIEADELSALSDRALDRYTELRNVSDDDITDEQLSELEALADGIRRIGEERTSRAAAADERAARIAAAKTAIDEAAASIEEDPETEDGDEGEADEAEADDADESAEAQKEPAMAAAAAKKQSLASRAARLGSPAAPPAEDPAPAPARAVITAAAEVRGFAAGQELTDLDEAVKLMQVRLGSLPKGKAGVRAERFNALTITKPAQEGLVIDGKGGESELEVMMRAAREQRLPGGSLVASGGWCAPSENLYGLTSWETVSGMLDLPSVTVRRGGINYTKGPDFGTDIYGNADFGFIQTEAQAEAATEKPFLLVECPDFTDVRLDAIGFGIKAGILTNHAYPELIRRYVEGGLVAHQHKVNGSVINRILTSVGAAANFAELGSATGDLLHAIEIAVLSLRYKFRLDPSATVEGFLPVWAKAAIRADLSVRTGVDMTNVTDQQIDAHFATRGVRMQYVYDWAGQDLAGNETVLPSSVQFVVYPAGTFVKASDEVITLDAMYDSTDIKTNTYTAIFAEESLLVANMYGNGRRFEVGLNYRGATGFPAIGAGEGITIPTV